MAKKTALDPEKRAEAEAKAEARAKKAADKERLQKLKAEKKAATEAKRAARAKAKEEKEKNAARKAELEAEAKKLGGTYPAELAPFVKKLFDPNVTNPGTLDVNRRLILQNTPKKGLEFMLYRQEEERRYAFRLENDVLFYDRESELLIRYGDVYTTKLSVNDFPWNGEPAKVPKPKKERAPRVPAKEKEKEKAKVKEKTKTKKGEKVTA